MGNRASRIACCFSSQNQSSKYPQDGYGVQFGEPLDEGLGHSFCYIRPILDSPISSPHQSTDLSISQPTLEASDSAEQCLPDLQQTEKPKNASISETSFKSISGASVSANTATPRSMICNELCNLQSERAATFEATPSFAALPLQLIPKGIAHSGSISGTLSGPLSGPLERGFLSGPIERGFMSGPLERGFLSGPMERGFMSGPLEQIDRTNLSAPLARRYRRYLKTRTSLKRFMKTVGNPVKKALSKTASNLVWPKLPFVGPLKGDRKKGSDGDSQDFSFDTSCASSNDVKEAQNLQWAQGRAGEDRMHVVLSEEHGWLFVGIYDGFNGPDAPDFLMGNLYPAIYKELKGLLWDTNEAFVLRSVGNQSNCDQDGKPLGSRDKGPRKSRINGTGWVRNHTKVSDMGLGQDLADLSIKDSEESSQYKSEDAGPCLSTDSVTVTAKTPNSQSNTFEQKTVYHPDKENSLRNLIFGDLARELEDHKQPGRKGSLGRKIKSVYGKRNRRNKKLFQWRYDWEQERLEAQKSSTEDSKQDQGHRKETRRMAVNHAAVLKALSRALLETEAAFLEMADKAASENPELALMGSCVLVMLMKDEDVYIMNVGDSRAIVAQRKKVGFLESLGKSSSWQVRLGDAKLDNQERIGSRDSMLRMELEKIIEETPMELAAQESYDFDQISPPAVSSTLGALQLSFDHSTSVPEEVMRIKALHADDAASVSNDRVKGSLKVTRAFGAGFLKQPKWNDALLEMFRIDYVGTAPYITCKPSLSHHKLGPRDHFLVLSSDGLYQYLSNEEVVSHVEWFMEKSPDGDPAQYLIEELLFRAARKAGMDFHELLDIPQGDRRKYHDDVSVMVISLEGRIWRSSS